MQKVSESRQYLRTLAIGLSLLSLLASCSESTMGVNSTEAADMESQLDNIASKSIFFAHMSVGSNILDGVENIVRPRFEVRDISFVAPGDLPDAPAFTHANIGENTKPLTKVTEFENLLESGIGAKADVAGMKFCYVDFSEQTDIDGVFASYSAMIDRLREKYPTVYFMHFTVPLTVTQDGPKVWIKRLIGRDPAGAADNLARQDFNEMMRSAYGDDVFDLAALESTKTDGSRMTGLLNGRRYYSLIPAYTTDGGHLNGEASHMIAREFLSFLDKAKY